MKVDVYEHNADQYDDFQGAFMAGNELAGRLYRGMFEGLGMAPGQKILEIGVGTGFNLGFYPEGAEIFGVDRSAGMLAHAERRLGETGRRATLSLGDATKLDFPDESFDRIVIAFVLCSCADPRSILREAARVVRRGGRIGTFDYHKAKTNADLIGDQMFINETMKNGIYFKGRPVVVADSLYDLDEHIVDLGVRPIFDERIERSLANSFRAAVLERT